jgi:hypothetical protein
VHQLYQGFQGFPETLFLLVGAEWVQWVRRWVHRLIFKKVIVLNFK